MALNARRFFRTPKGLLILLLAALSSVAIVQAGVGLALPGVAAAVLAAMLVDAPILRWRHRRWEFPDGALLTGLIVAAVMSPHEPWRITALTAAVAVASKYVLRARKANVFNPAAFGLVATFYLFNTGQSWWGALAELPLPAVSLVIVAGVFITWRVNKVPVVLAFLGAYYRCVTAAAFVGEPAHVAELYRTPDLHAALYFALFMVTDPPTSPPRERDQLVFGLITGVVAFAAFQWIGAAYWLLAGLLVANGWEAWRRATP
jgi:Na+-translocating ferredoxin:NAD+ oxidoreductase RnfD subunit